MLTRIRAALGRDAAAPAPEPLPPFSIYAAAPAGAESLSEQFGVELARVGGCLARLGSAAEIRSRLETLLSEHAHAAVAVSDAPVMRELNLREWLAGEGFSVVPSFREFEASAREGTESRPVQDASRRGEPDIFGEYKRALGGATVGVTSADYALADTGTLVLVSGGEQHRLISLLPPVLVCLLSADRILPGATELLARVHEESYARGTAPQSLTCITGPSRTADIEHVITLGIHGPQALHVLLHPPAA